MSVDLTEIEQAEDELEQWLVDQAKTGVPEVVLVSLLRNYADGIEAPNSNSRESITTDRTH